MRDLVIQLGIVPPLVALAKLKANVRILIHCNFEDLL